MSDELQDVVHSLGQMLNKIYDAGMAKHPREAVQAVADGIAANRVGLSWQIDVDQQTAPTVKCSVVSLKENKERVVLFALVLDESDLAQFKFGRAATGEPSDEGPGGVN